MPDPIERRDSGQQRQLPERRRSWRGTSAVQVGVEMTTPVERRRAQNIEMTTPVDRKRQGQRWIVTFTMPEQYELETLPEPLDERVQLREDPVRRFAVTRFSGAPSEREVQRRMRALALAVNEAGLTKPGEPPVYSRYDPPWTLAFRRRNEIMLELAPLESASD